jgi:hypothetical protein
MIGVANGTRWPADLARLIRTVEPGYPPVSGFVLATHPESSDPLRTMNGEIQVPHVQVARYTASESPWCKLRTCGNYPHLRFIDL